MITTICLDKLVPVRNRSAATEVEDVSPELEHPPSTPTWVKVFAVAFLILLLAIAVMLLHGAISGQGPFDQVRHS